MHSAISTGLELAKGDDVCVTTLYRIHQRTYNATEKLLFLRLLLVLPVFCFVFAFAIIIKCMQQNDHISIGLLAFDVKCKSSTRLSLWAT